MNSMSFRTIQALALSLVLSTSSFAQRGVSPISTTINDSGTGTSLISSSSFGAGGPWNGLDISTVIGADRFYNNGYTGTRAITSNVEGGLIWNGHETLTGVNTFLYSNHPSLFGTAIGQFDRHATWVGHNMAGQGSDMHQRGIAYGAQLWSGGIATVYGTPPWSNSWGWANGFAFTSPYETSMLNGINGATADVINSSWGFTEPNNFNVFAVSLDGMVRASGKTLVFAAGNSGSGVNTVQTPGNGFNSIVVGALGPDLDLYQSIASFSSSGPVDYHGPDGSFSAARARVDIAAPGQSMTLAFYGGVTGGNAGGTDPTGGANNWYTLNAQGTSFAAPTVAGAAALMVDAGKAVMGGGESIDGRVIKSVMQTAASKPVDWDNGQVFVSGTWITTQALDYTYGTGRLDMDKAYDIFLNGTRNLAGELGGNVQSQGWDMGVLQEGAQNDYFFNDQLLGGETLTATLNWFVNAEYNGNMPGGSILTAADSFTNMDLELWATSGGVATTMIADSAAMFINTQHIYVTLPQTGSYMLRVKWIGERYDFVGNSSEAYALSWTTTSSPVPEPASFAILGCGALFLLRVRRRKTA